MTVHPDTFRLVYDRLNKRFDATPTDTVRNCYDRVMRYGNRKNIIPWFYK